MWAGYLIIGFMAFILIISVVGFGFVMFEYIKDTLEDWRKKKN